MPKDAKDAGKKLPDPKVWKWCKHPECQKKVKKIEGWDDPETKQKLMREKPYLCALFLEDFCWKHLSDDAKTLYKTKIEKNSIIDFSFAGSNFLSADLKGVNCCYVNFREAMLVGVNLEKASLIGCDFRQSDLRGVNLQEAYVFEGKFQKANLEGANLKNAILRKAELQRANLEYAELQGANLEGAQLQEANCHNADFSGAYFGGTKFEYALLIGAIWDNAYYLEWWDVKRVGDEKPEYVKKRGWWGARSAYRALKNYFHQQGKYDAESKAYYREKLMVEREACSYWVQGYQRHSDGSTDKLVLKARIHHFFHWLGLVIFHRVTGFGERWWWTVLWALGFIAFFGFLYWGGGAAGWFKFAFKPEMIPSIFQYFYLSVVTFATLGFGDITPLCWQAQVPVVIEVIFGYLFLGLIITIIARRFGR